MSNDQVNQNAVTATNNASAVNALGQTVVLDAVVPSSVFGPRQRLRVFVPTAHTVMSLGDTDSRDGQYDGFSIFTEGHILYSAMGGSPGESRMVFESKENLVLQSFEASLYVAAKGSTFLAAGGNALVGGKGGVCIIGGVWNVGDPVQDSRSGGTLSLADQGSISASAHSDVGTFWSAATVALVALRAAGDALSAKAKAKAEGIGARLGAPALAAIAPKAAAIALNVHGMASSNGLAGALVHGDSGTIAGSPMFASLYGGVGLTIFSPVGTFIGARSTSLYGRSLAKMTSRQSVGVSSKKAVEVIAKGDLNVAARTAGCSLAGKKVTVGGGSSGAQGTAASAVFAAEKTLSLVGDKVTVGGTNIIGVGGDDITVGAVRAVTFGAKSKLSLNAGTAQILLTDSEVKVGIGKNVSAAAGRPAYPGKSAGFASGGADKEKSHAGSLSGHVGKCVGAQPGKTYIKITSSSVEFDSGCKIKASSAGWAMPNLKIF